MVQKYKERLCNQDIQLSLVTGVESFALQIVFLFYCKKTICERHLSRLSGWVPAWLLPFFNQLHKRLFKKWETSDTLCAVV